MQDFYNPLLIHAQNQCWNGRVIAPCTTLFLIKKKLHVLETLFYESQRGKKDMISLRKLISSHDCLYIS